jgi:site-specific recombinase XerD
MQTHKAKYLEFILKTKGVSVKYADVASIHIEKVIKFLGEKGIADINLVTRKDLDAFQEEIMREPYANITKQNILMACALFFRYLYDYGFIKDNPGLVIEPPRKEEHIPRNIMNTEEIKFLFTLPNQEDLIGIRDFCIMSLLYSSAMRTIELFNLKLEDVDLVRSQAVVKRPKNKRDRIVCFDRYTAFYLKKYLDKVRPWLLRSGKSDHFFISATGTNLSKASWAAHFSRKYKPAMDKKFKKHITPYAFRHTSATHWLDSGAKQHRDVLPFIQRQLGHESLESTAIYTHVAIEPLRQMFRMYHPREISLKALHRVPSPDEIIGKHKDGPEEPPQAPTQVA